MCYRVAHRHNIHIYCVYVLRVALVVSNSLWPCRLWAARLLCPGVLQARILERIGQYWLPYPSRALYFLQPQPPVPLSSGAAGTPVTQGSALPPHLAFTAANPNPLGQTKEQTSVDESHVNGAFRWRCVVGCWCYRCKIPARNIDWTLNSFSVSKWMRWLRKSEQDKRKEVEDLLS